jgi:hypothetical protein
VLSQAAWLTTLKSLGTSVYSGGGLLVSRAPTVFDAQGQLTDERTRQMLAEFMAGFAAFVRQQRR